MKQGWVSGKRANNQAGFTIVELLIVIVVIGILAAITIVAYNGVQQKANNASRISAAQSAVKLISAYRVINDGAAPIASVCLTTECTNWAGTVVTGDNSALLTELKKVGNPPTVSKAANKYNGIMYNMRASTATFDGDGSQRVVLLMFWLEGQNQDCKVSNVAVQGPGEAWQRATEKYSYSYAPENVTACWVSV